MKKTIKQILFFTIMINFVISNYLVPKSSEQVKSQNGMVVTASKLASEIGVKILKDGENAIDAEVAVGFSLAVTYSYAGNLGGGGFLVLHFKDGTNTTIDYRKKAPLSATKNMYLDNYGKYIPELSEEGATSVGVPESINLNNYIN